VFHLQIQIACAIAGYSKVSMHKFKNITDNPLIYTDTDSVVLSNAFEWEIYW